MSVLIATLGGSEDVVKLGVRKMEDVDKVVLIAGKPLSRIVDISEIKDDGIMVDPIKKATDLKRLLEDLGVEVEIHEVNAFDFEECLVTIIKLIQSISQDVNKAINLTGGTKTLSLAAMSAAWMCGCKAFIIQEMGSGDVKLDLPIPDSEFLNGIGDQMKRILAYLLKEETRPGILPTESGDEQMRSFITKNIAGSLGVEPQSIIPNLKVMEANGLIKGRRGAIKRGEPFGGKSSVKIWWLTDEGRIYATLFSK